MFALLFLITEHRLGSHSGVGWHQVDLSYNLSKLHISAEVCLPITHQKELTAHLRQDDPPSKRIIHQRRFRTKFLCGNTCVWTLQLVMVCIYEKKRNGWTRYGGGEVQIANVTLVATRSCNTHIQMLSLNGSRILQKGFHHMRCNILSRWLAKWSSSVLIVKSSLSSDLLGLVCADTDFWNLKRTHNFGNSHFYLW